MAVVDDPNSLHQDRTEHASNQSYSSPLKPESKTPADLIIGSNVSKENDDEVGIDEDLDEDDDEDRSNYLFDSILKRPTARFDDMERTLSARSLSSAKQLDEDTSWNTNSSVHSSTSKTDICSEQNKSWKTMDSVHTTASGQGSGAMADAGNASMDFEDSCCSFASFGDSDSTLDFSGPDLSIQRAAFTRLSEDATPRRMLMKSESLRMQRGVSFRGTGLALIEESDSLD
jgi:hypothetical protein